MPKETFLNLPAEKRARFVDVALDEFCARPFDQASVTTIVARLGIAKGSVYQYFEDKVDLFSWLVEESGRRKLEVLGPPVFEQGSLFSRLRGMYRSGLVFWQREPRWARVALRLLEPSSEPRLEAIRRGYANQALVWMTGELRAARDAGELRSGLDVAAVAPLVLAVLQEGLLRSILTRAGTDLGDPAVGEKLAALPVVELEAAADVAILLLEQGLGAIRTDRAR